MTGMNKKTFQIFEKNKFKTFDQIENLISNLPTTKEQGDAMELFCKYYFQLNAELYQVKNIWLLDEAPLEIKKELGLTTDLEVDLNTNFGNTNGTGPSSSFIVPVILYVLEN